MRCRTGCSCVTFYALRALRTFWAYWASKTDLTLLAGCTGIAFNSLLSGQALCSRYTGVSLIPFITFYALQTLYALNTGIALIAFYALWPDDSGTAYPRAAVEQQHLTGATTKAQLGRCHCTIGDLLGRHRAIGDLRRRHRTVDDIIGIHLRRKTLHRQRTHRCHSQPPDYPASNFSSHSFPPVWFNAVR